MFENIRSTFTGPGKDRDLRTKLWRGGGLVGIFIFTWIICNSIIPKDQAVTWDMLGHDFLAFYFGGTMARTGHYEKLFELPVARAFEFKTGTAAHLALGTSFGPWWNPPFAAWMFAPLTAYPYLTALHIWWTIGGICLALSLFLMCRMLKGGWKTQLLVPLFVLTVMPCFQAFCHGQNTFVSLLMLTVTVTLWRKNQSVLAGIVCGLMFYKPQLGAMVALALCISKGRRAMFGVALTGTFLVLVNVLTMPGTLHNFVYSMPGNMRWMQEQNHYRWERHITFKAFWRLALQGWDYGPTALAVKALWALCEVSLLAGLGAVAWKTIRTKQSASQTDRLIAATIIAMPLLMPFYFDYDLLLISVGVVLYAVDRQRDPISMAHRGDRWLVRVWIALCIIVAALVAHVSYEPILGWVAAGCVAFCIAAGMKIHQADQRRAQTSNIRWEDRWLVRLFVMLFGILELTMLYGHTRIHPVVPLLTVTSFFLIRRGTRPQAEEAKAAVPEPLVTPPFAVAA